MYSVKYIFIIHFLTEEAELATSVIPSLVGSGPASIVASRAASKQAGRSSLLTSRAPSVLDKVQVAAAGSMSQLCKLNN